MISFPQTSLENHKENRVFAGLRYGEEDSISPRSLIFAAPKG